MAKHARNHARHSRNSLEHNGTMHITLAEEGIGKEAQHFHTSIGNMVREGFCKKFNKINVDETMSISMEAHLIFTNRIIYRCTNFFIILKIHKKSEMHFDPDNLGIDYEIYPIKII